MLSKEQLYFLKLVVWKGRTAVLCPFVVYWCERKKTKSLFCAIAKHISLCAHLSLLWYLKLSAWLFRAPVTHLFVVVENT